jgi:hypothetical protein
MAKCKHSWIPIVETIRHRMIWGTCVYCWAQKYWPPRGSTEKAVTYDIPKQV